MVLVMVDRPGAETERLALSLNKNNSHHVKVCPVSGRGIRAHDEFKSNLAHALEFSGIVSEVRTKICLSARCADPRIRCYY